MLTIFFMIQSFDVVWPDSLPFLFRSGLTSALARRAPGWRTPALGIGSAAANAAPVNLAAEQAAANRPEHGTHGAVALGIDGASK